MTEPKNETKEEILETMAEGNILFAENYAHILFDSRFMHSFIYLIYVARS